MYVLFGAFVALVTAFFLLVGEAAPRAWARDGGQDKAPPKPEVRP